MKTKVLLFVCIHVENLSIACTCSLTCLIHSLDKTGLNSGDRLSKLHVYKTILYAYGKHSSVCMLI